jgi:MFS transporter, ACS family, tartrate transporter
MTLASNMVTTSIETQTIRKLQIRILPYILLLYIISYLDRINIGFAALTMNQELSITSQQFGLLVGVFFISYSLFEIPSNLILHKVGARVWIARILIVWGIVAALTGFVRTVHQLYIVRFLLGLGEAGFYPGILLYLTSWFRRREQAQAIAMFMTGVPISNILGAPLSGLILDHVHWLGMSSWRWLMVLEGFPAVIFGVLTYFLLPNRPAEARFLTESEKDWITTQLNDEEKEKQDAHQVSAVGALVHGRVWHLALTALIHGAAHYSLFFWIPQIVKTLSRGYSNTTIGILVMVPYLTGLLAMIPISRRSDSKLERRWHVAIPAMIAGIACITLGSTHSIFIAVVLLSVAVGCICGYLGPFWALPSEFLTGASAASGIALVTTLVNLGGFFGPYAFGFIRQKTHSFSGALAIDGVVFFAFATMVLLLRGVSGGLARQLPRPNRDGAELRRT